MNYLLPLSIVMGLIGYGLIARWYLWPWIIKQSKTNALIPLTIPHVFRYVGLAFLIEGVTAGPLDPRFAQPAAWGDLITAFLTLIAVSMLKTKTKGALAVTWAFNCLDYLIC